ncbi:MAG: nucleotidyltransferase domain-containing protein [Nitrospirae bacterium]|nr:nucleotidyltransferase domain-containing protein [Nitrospirota bacterium]
MRKAAVIKIINTTRTVLDNYEGKIPFAFLFGSWTKGRQTSLSDIDLAIFFRDMPESVKTKIEHQISLLFDEQVNILRLEDENISPLIKLESLKGIPITSPDSDFLNGFILSIIHKAEEMRRLLDRLRDAA